MGLKQAFCRLTESPPRMQTTDAKWDLVTASEAEPYLFLWSVTPKKSSTSQTFALWAPEKTGLSDQTDLIIIVTRVSLWELGCSQTCCHHCIASSFECKFMAKVIWVLPWRCNYTDWPLYKLRFDGNFVRPHWCHFPEFTAIQTFFFQMLGKKITFLWMCQTVALLKHYLENAGKT